MKTKDLVGRKVSRSNRMLVAEAYSRGVEFEILPKRRFKMSYQGKSYLIRRGRISLSYNNRLAVRTADLKEVTSRLLRSKGHPSPENTVFSKGDLERAWNWAEPILPVVLKPHNGVMGKLVFVNLDSYEEFKECYEKVTEKHNEVLVEKFISGDEFRFTYVNNEIVGVANRVPANVIGDGKNTVKRLVELKNEERQRRKNPIHKKIELDKESDRVLQKKGHSLDYTPKNKEVINLRDNSNVSTGGDAIEVTDEMGDEIKDSVRKAIRSIPGIRVCGVDVLIHGNEFYILEINTHPMLSMHHYPWKGNPQDVISKVIDGMFPKTI